MNKPITEKIKEWFNTHFKLPLGVKITVCVFPAVLIALFYALRSVRGAMDWVSVYVARPVRGFFTMIYSFYPLAVMEVLCTAAGVFLIYYIVVAIRDSSRRRNKWKLFGKRMLVLFIAVCYVYSAWCWLWNTGYHATGFAERYRFSNTGVETSDLIAVTEMFADRASELSVLLERDEDRNLISNRSEMFAQSRYIYTNAAEQFPSLRGTVYAPKSMYFYSWLMTITGYTGMYFALTGESMINIQQHAAYMPATVSHEIAHQLGVFAEDEATFAGIMACITSGDPVFEYSGYLSGLSYLANALAFADRDEYVRIMSGLTYEVKLDRMQNSEFWANAQNSNLGIDWLDNFLTSLMLTTDTVVDTVYDDYLKSQNQELGVRSYGAAVDLLVEYFAPEAISLLPATEDSEIS